MAKHEELYPLVLTEVPGCPLPTLRQAINLAAAEFCHKSLAWQEALDPIPVVAGRWRYETGLPAQARLVVLHAVKLDGRALRPLADPRSAAAFGLSQGAPAFYALAPDWSEIRLDPVPPSAGLLTLQGAFAPTFRATSLPDVLVERYYAAISEGAKALLKRMPGQPWSDPSGAPLAEHLFQQKTSEARIEAEAGRVVGGMRVTPRAFGS